MRLTRRRKKWIYYNIEKWMKHDLYLKNINADISLSSLKKYLKISHTLDEFIEYLNTPEHNQAFRFHRKEGKYFLYPSIKDQVESLVSCWEEIIKIFSQEKSDSRRKIFGQLPNIMSHHDLSNKKLLYKDRVLSCNRPVLTNFSTEYEEFKKASLHLMKSFLMRTKRTRSIVFFQTDMASFFHSLGKRPTIPSG